MKLPSSFPKDSLERSHLRDGGHRERVCINDVGFLYGRVLLSYQFIQSWVSVWIPGFAFAFCIITLCIRGCHIYGFNHLWLTALKKTASVLYTHRIFSCHSLFSQPLSFHVTLGTANQLERLKTRMRMRTDSVQSVQCITRRAHASYDCCIQGLCRALPVGDTEPSCHNIDFSAQIVQKY